MNPLLQEVLEGEYALGAARHAGLTHPTAEDDRWGGLCALHAGEFVEADRLLRRAVARGHAEAGIELASLRRTIGEPDAARAALAALDPDGLGPLDAALWWREHALVLLAGGRDLDADAALDRAWGAAVAAPPAVQVAVAQSVAMVAADRGEDEKAAAHFEFAERHAHPARRAYLGAARALSLARLGALDLAERALASAAAALGAAPLATPTVLHHQGVLARWRGRAPEAERAFALAAQAARAYRQPDTEFHAELGRAAVATAREDADAARAALARARALLDGPLRGDPLDAARLALRSGAWRAALGERGAIEELASALAVFEARGRRREALVARLHLAEAALRLRDPAAPDEIARAVDAHFALGGAAEPELGGLTVLRAHLDAAPPGTYGRALRAVGPSAEWPEVHLVTLGTPALWCDGRRLKLQLARTPEILAYLLSRPDRTLGEVQSALFPDTPPKRSKNYFHQVRLDVRRSLAGLEIRHDPARRTYRVEASGVRLVWDWRELEGLARSGPPLAGAPLADAVERYQRVFLPDSDTEWAQEERARVLGALQRSGLGALEARVTRGEHGDVIDVAERLLRLDPLDEMLHETLVEARWRHEGPVLALAALRTAQRTFLEEVGEVPIALEALGRRLGEALRAEERRAPRSVGAVL